MENKLQIFKNDEFGEIRSVEINGEIYFVAADVCRILEVGDTSNAVKTLDDDEKGTHIISTVGGLQKMLVVNEAGLYRLIFKSRKPDAKKFQRWIYHEVIPAIRKHGAYMTPATIENIIANPDFGIELLKNLKSEREKRIAAEKTIEQQKPKVLFADAVETSNTSILIGELAKLLKQNGVDIGQNRLFDWLRDNGYLIKAKRSDWNMPTQSAMDMKLFEVKERVINNPDGSVLTTRTTKVTGKGQTYFVNKFLNKKAVA